MTSTTGVLVAFRISPSGGVGFSVNGPVGWVLFAVFMVALLVSTLLLPHSGSVALGAPPTGFAAVGDDVRVTAVGVNVLEVWVSEDGRELLVDHEEGACPGHDETSVDTSGFTVDIRFVAAITTGDGLVACTSELRGHRSSVSLSRPLDGRPIAVRAPL